MIKGAKPCPFCGTRMLEKLIDVYAYVQCGWCHARGPGYAYESHNEAIEEWNKRSKGKGKQPCRNALNAT